MLLRKITACFATIAALTLLVPPASGQNEIHRGRPYVDGDGNNPDLWQPFVDTTAFPHDMQFFAPAEFGEFGDGPQPSTGWFGAAERMNIRMSRPDAEPASTEGDWTWGNRFTLGYMSPENHGWFGEFSHIDGPNYFNVTEAERVNVLEPDDAINGDPDNVDLRGGGGGGGGGGGRGKGNANTGLPLRGVDKQLSQDRRYFIRGSDHVAGPTFIEVKQAFRWGQRNHRAQVR
ncbi:MAG: hypothetical protein H8E66_05455, partial [Planctomycetes bacterium]|nr:hypothetical protein [Planctomycetota bacterium]